MRNKTLFTDFGYGFVIGFITAVIILMTIFGLVYIGNKNRERLNYVELQMEIEAIREDYINLDVSDFLEIPDVRRAADGARDEFERKLDEILLRFRGGDFDRRDYGGGVRGD